MASRAADGSPGGPVRAPSTATTTAKATTAATAAEATATAAEAYRGLVAITRALPPLGVKIDSWPSSHRTR